MKNGTKDIAKEKVEKEEKEYRTFEWDNICMETQEGQRQD